tara:strand:- start:2981 stop:4693 length:1713 start_codon:yes stop_codon:yes gene_type:complete
MTNRYPLVVNATTNQITEVQSGDNLLLDNTDLATSSGDLVLDPAGDVDIKADLKNTADPNLKVDDDLYVTGAVGIGVAPISNIDLKIERTWNNSATTFFGTNIDITDTASNANSRLLRLAVGNVTKFDVDADGDTNIYGTTTLHGNATFGANAIFNSAAYFDGAPVEIRNAVPTLLFNDTNGGAQTDYSITANIGVFTLEDVTNSDTFFKYTSNDAVELYFNNSSKLATTNTGVSVTGNGSFSGNLTVNGNSTLGDTTSDEFAINARLTTSIVPKTDGSVDLGTTTLRWGDLYVDDISVTTGINVGTINASDGTTALTLSNTSGDVAVNGDLTVSGNDIKSNGGTTAITLSGANVTIAGNLTVSGTETIINTSTLSVEDATIELRRGASLSAADGGIQVNRTTDAGGAVTAYQQLLWDESESSWRTTDGTTPKTIVNNVDATSLAKLTLNSGVVESFVGASAVGAAGIVTLDQDSSNIHVHTNPGGDFSFRVTNVPTTNDYVVSILCIVKQGATPGQPTTFHINGTDISSLTLGLSGFGKGTNGQTDVYSFQCFRQGGAWHVLADRSNFS